MEYQLDRKGERRLVTYFDRIGGVLRTAPQRASFATYALGLMGDGERKSAEPMAARACPDPDRVDDAHQRLTYFTRGAEWSDREVRSEAARYALAAMTAREPVTDWIIDDTGFPKQGTHSVGVQRQYFLHHRALGRRARPDQMVAPLPLLSPTSVGGTAWCTCR